MKFRFFTAILPALLLFALTLATGCGANSSSPQATLQSIAVTASSNSVVYGLTQQFKATGTYSDATTADLTGSVVWTSSNSDATLSTTTAGLATGAAVGPSTITATDSGSGIRGSAELTVTQATPTISWTAPAAITYGTALSATQLNASCSVPGKLVYSPAAGTVLGAGTQQLTVNCAPTDATDYAAPSPAQVSLVVNEAVLTVAANDTSRYFDASNPAFGVSYSGFVNGDTASVLSGSPGITTTATASSAAGSYSITPALGTLAAANYSFSFVSGTLTVEPLPLRAYSGSASVGDFLSISIDPNAGTLTYTNLSNGATNSGNPATYTVSASGSATLSDPNGNLLSLSEVPGFGIVALMNNAGPAQDQLALVTSIPQQTLSASTFEPSSFNMMEFRTTGGGVGVSSLNIDGGGNISGLQYMPFNKLGTTDPSGFQPLPSFQLPANPTTPYYLLLEDTPPPNGSGNNYIFGVSGRVFLDDNQDGAMIGLPKAASPNFQGAWAGSYNFTYYRKSNAYSNTGNSQEVGDVSWGVATLTLAVDGGNSNNADLTVVSSQGATILSGTLTPISTNSTYYDGTTTDGLGDPCNGIFTMHISTDGNGNPVSQDVFVAFMDGAVLLTSFSTADPVNPGDDYNYFYGAGLPAASATTVANTGNENAGGSNTANPVGPWNSLGGGTVSATAQRNYIGSSASGDLMSITVDPANGTLSYYDYNNSYSNPTDGNGNSTITYSLSNGTSTVSDPDGNVLGALELPNQLLLLEVNNTGFAGFNLPINPNTGNPDPAYDPAMLVIAVPVMNLTTADFAGQNYNFMQLRSTEGDITVGSMAIDQDGNFTANGFTPWGALSGANAQTFANLDPLTFPAETYPNSIVATTDDQSASQFFINFPTNILFQQPDYLFGYPGSLALLTSSTYGTLVGIPQNSTAAFQSSVDDNQIHGTYQVMFFRRQVESIGQYGNENGPGGPGGTTSTPNTWKNLTQIDGAAMGIDTLTITSTGTATLTDNSNNSQALTGQLLPLSTDASLPIYGAGMLTNPCNGLYTMVLTSGSGPTLQTQHVILGFVPGSTPAVVMSVFTSPNATPSSPSSTNYTYRYGMGFMTSTTP